MMGMQWQWTLSKRRLLMDNSLFEDGNYICYSPVKQSLAVDDRLATDNSEDYQQYTCEIASCGQTFKSLSSFESHYGLVHSHVCQTCKRSFPTSHLLDLHLQEWHDSMFELLAQKQSMYQCLVESCEHRFFTKRERKNHLVVIHKYPGNYRFDRDHYKDRKKSGHNMDVDVKLPEKGELDDKLDVKNMIPNKRTFSYKVPNTICFGQGTSRGFQRPRGRGRGRGHKKGQHWHNRGQCDVETHVDIEQVDLMELQQALD